MYRCVKKVCVYADFYRLFTPKKSSKKTSYFYVKFGIFTFSFEQVWYYATV